MILTFRVVRNALQLARIAALTVLVLSAGSLVRAQLLFERVQGGPREYTSYTPDDVEFAAIYFSEPVRITGITGWIGGGGGPMGLVGIYGDSLEQGFSASFPLTPGFDVEKTPGVWRGTPVGSLKWDLQPGNYLLAFSNVWMPFSFGYDGSPISDAPQPSYYLARWEGTGPLQESPYPFGVRVYGTLLSAIPESSTWGLAGGVALLGLILVRRRRRISAETSGA